MFESLLSCGPMTGGETPAHPGPLLYIIHAAADRDLAIHLRSRIKDAIPDLRVFVASNAGDIPTGEDWLVSIQQNLTPATAFLLLLTPRSVERHWIWYEAGVAWARDIKPLPVTAGRLDRASVPYPLGAAQILDLEQPADAAQLFRDLGGDLEAPDAFCRAVQATALPPPASAADVQHVRDALAQVHRPPRAVLRRMLAGESLDFKAMQAVLEEKRFVSDGHSVQRVLDALINTGVIQADGSQRWSVRPEVRETVRRCLAPSLAQRFLDLADEMRDWSRTQTTGFDGNYWHQEFVLKLRALREKAKTDHGEDDAWFEKIPSHYTAVNQIADALVRVAQRFPEE